MTDATELPNLPGIDTADGMRRMMNKASLYEKVLRDFHARFINEPQAIRATIAGGDLLAAERHAHSAKGLAGTIGAPGLQEAARALELALHGGDAAPEQFLLRFERELQLVLDSIASGFGIGRAG